VLIAQHVFECRFVAFERKHGLDQPAPRRLGAVAVVPVPTIEVRVEVMLLAVDQLPASEPLSRCVRRSALRAARLHADKPIGRVPPTVPKPPTGGLVHHTVHDVTIRRSAHIRL
jgi:hypothetical protein